jgi:hypothetical protein
MSARTLSRASSRLRAWLPVAGQRVEAVARGVRQSFDAVEVDPEVDLRRDLVDVLPARTGRADGADRERRRRDTDRAADDDRLAHAGIVASAEWTRPPRTQHNCRQ